MKLRDTLLTVLAACSLAVGNDETTPALDSAPSVATGASLEGHVTSVRLRGRGATRPWLGSSGGGVDAERWLIVWTMRSGGWNGTTIAGRSIGLLLECDRTPGTTASDGDDLVRAARSSRSVTILVDEEATPGQEDALLAALDTLLADASEVARRATRLRRVRIERTSEVRTADALDEERELSLRVDSWTIDAVAHDHGDGRCLCARDATISAPVDGVDESQSWYAFDVERLSDGTESVPARRTDVVAGQFQL